MKAKSKKNKIIGKEIILLFTVLILLISALTIGSIAKKPSEGVKVVNEANLELKKPQINSTHEIPLIGLNQEEIEEVSTKYSFLLKDDIKRKMYVFSTPIRDTKFESITNVLSRKIEETDGHYSVLNDSFDIDYQIDTITVESCNDYFSVHIKNVHSYEFISDYVNLYGEKAEAIKYSTNESGDIFVYPTFLGIGIEQNLNENCHSSSFPIEFRGYNCDQYNAGYVILSNNDEKKAIFHRAILFDNNDNYLTYVNAIAEKSENNCEITYEIPSEIVLCRKMLTEFYLYSEKMFFDTSVYEAIPKDNTLFNNFSVFDSLNKNNLGYTYLKFNIASFTPKSANLLKSAVLNFYVFSVDSEAVVEVYEIERDWCSWLLTWKNRENFKKQIGQFTITGRGWYSIDLTEYAKNLLDNGYYGLEDNSIVLKLKDSNSSVLILSSTDNTYAPPFFVVEYNIQ